MDALKIRYYNDNRALIRIDLRAGDRCRTISGRSMTVVSVKENSITFDTEKGERRVLHEYAVSMFKVGAWIKEID